MDATPVDRCVCRNITFAEILRQRDAGADPDAILRQTGAGATCGLCRPYIRAALVTGRARFPVLSEAELNALHGAR